MKRLRFGGEAEMESVNMANVLMLLSRGQETGRVFECKTCNRKFPSFQALGGHRASHKKPRVLEGGDGQAQGTGGKTRVHECSICGLEFAIGQALGGHMRRHRAAATEKKSGGKRVLWLDLNLPASEEDMECPEIGLGLGLGLALVDKTSMMDCFH